jgi:uncharacterized membrane protein
MEALTDEPYALSSAWRLASLPIPGRLFPHCACLAIGALAYESLGVSSSTAIFLLLATLIGSFFNIPITELPPERAISHHVIDFFGMRCAVPAVSHWKGTVVAVNVGGAVIPTLMSAHLLAV